MSGGTGDVMVAVDDPEQVSQLVRTAADLALLGTGTIRLVTVVVSSYASPFGVFDDETIIREFAADSHELLAQADPPEGVEVVRDLVVARTVAKGLISAVEDEAPSALVIGWDSDPSRSDALLGTTVDTVLERAPTDVFVERIGREANGVESVLMPVAGGPHVTAAALSAKAIALRNDATVHLLSVVEDGAADRAQGFIEEGRAALVDAPGNRVPIETQTVDASDPTRAIVDAAPAHDVIVLGATRKGPLRGRLVGSVPRRVVRRSDRTVLIARDGDVVQGLGARLATLLRR